MFDARAGVLTPSCREGAAILRGLSHGVAARLSEGDWRFDEIEPIRGAMTRLPLWRTWPHGPLDPTWIEWTLEGGYAKRADRNSTLTITTLGREYVRALDFSARYCIASPSDIKMDGLVERIEDIRSHHPDDDFFVVAQMLAQVVLANVFSMVWLEEHLKNPRTADPFFGGDSDDDRVRTQGMYRLILLAEMILNMRSVPGLASSIRKIEKGDIEPGFAELEVGRLLHVAGAAYRFVEPKRRKGDDYDLELLVAGNRICAETKCKIETTPMAVSGLIDALRTARGQMPDGVPGMVFVKIPESWNIVQNDDEFARYLKDVSDKFFHGFGKYRGTEHVVSVKFHSNTLTDTGATYAPTLLMTEFSNPRHRFDRGADWDVLNKIDVETWPGKWVQLLNVCAREQDDATQ